MQEQWKPIENYEGSYEISNLGRVKSLAREVLGKNGSIRRLKERVLKPRFQAGRPPGPHP